MRRSCCYHVHDQRGPGHAPGRAAPSPRATAQHSRQASRVVLRQNITHTRNDYGTFHLKNRPVDVTKRSLSCCLLAACWLRRRVRSTTHHMVASCEPHQTTIMPADMPACLCRDRISLHSHHPPLSLLDRVLSLSTTHTLIRHVNRRASLLARLAAGWPMIDVEARAGQGRSPGSTGGCVWKHGTCHVMSSAWAQRGATGGGAA